MPLRWPLSRARDDCATRTPGTGARVARYLTFRLSPDNDTRADARAPLAGLARHCDGRSTVIGLGVGAGLDGSSFVDALFRFTRPLTGSCFWCPPVRNGRLDLRSVLERR